MYRRRLAGLGYTTIDWLINNINNHLEIQIYSINIMVRGTWGDCDGDHRSGMEQLDSGADAL